MNNPTHLLDTHAMDKTPENPLLLGTTSEGVATVTMNRVALHNAFDEEQISRITQTFLDLGSDPLIRAIVLRANGRHFCAGADIGWMQRAAAASEPENRADAARFSAMMHAVFTCPKPVIAVVQGVAYGGGMGLCCAADIVIATPDARFALTEAKFGIIPAVIGPYVIQAVGVRAARLLALTCRPIAAADAKAIGLVQFISELDQVDITLRALLSDIMRGGPLAQQEIKSLFARIANDPVSNQSRDLAATTIARLRAGPEAMEGFNAFMEKRHPVWASIA
jgi:methylglutaconyl-CoA hydratase